MAPSFQALLDAHVSRAHRAAYGFLGNRETAREAAQEALLKAYKARGSYDVSRPFYPWLYTIIRNTCLDIIAKARRRPRSGLDVERMVSPVRPSDEQLRRRREAARLHVSLGTLNEQQQEIINLRHFQMLSYAEIAEVLGVAEGTVMSRLFRARKALARAIEEEGR